MARSVEDATRFTPNGPYASRPSRGTVLQFADPAPANETPQQKIARLRAAARRAKLAEVSTFDKIVTSGRGLADKAHRVTVYGIVAFSAVTGLITIFTLTDMVVYNRNKRKAWLADMQAERAQKIEIAHQAAAQGIADEDQLLLLSQERLLEEAKLEKERRGGIFKRTKNLLFGGLSKEETQGGKLGEIAQEALSGSQLGGGASSQERGEGLGILKAVEQNEKLRQEKQAVGGPLDLIAEEATQAVKTTSKSWTSWITER